MENKCSMSITRGSMRREDAIWATRACTGERKDKRDGVQEGQHLALKAPGPVGSGEEGKGVWAREETPTGQPVREEQFVITGACAWLACVCRRGDNGLGSCPSSASSWGATP